MNGIPLANRSACATEKHHYYVLILGQSWLTVAFTKINGIEIIAIVQPRLDKLFRSQNSRGIKALKLRLQKVPNFLVEFFHRLLREDFTTRSCSVRQGTTDLKNANLRKPQSNSSWASFFFPQISISLAFAIPTGHLSGENNNCHCHVDSLRLAKLALAPPSATIPGTSVNPSHVYQ